VVISLLGLLEMIARLHAHAGAEETLRIGSTLGSPVALAAYLVLGMPLVFAELCCAEGREERDFWLISTTLVVVAVLLTQTRAGLVALWLSGAVFSAGVSGRAFRWFVGGAFGFLSMLVMAGALRLSPADLQGEIGHRVDDGWAAISTEFATPRGLVGTAPGRGAVTVVEVGGSDTEAPHKVTAENMHLTLFVRTGFIGWALMMWVIGAALHGISRASRRVEDRYLALLLWGIFSAGIGFVASMANFNAFYNPTTQVAFWGLLGVGTAIATHMTGQRPTFNVIYRFGQGE
jgi:cell division protein FtsW (lipid II flippase)